MKVLKPEVNIIGFFERVRQAEQCVLLLNYDGTLAPFCKERNRAVPYPGLRELLASILDDKNTRLVLISGRAIKDIIPLLGLKRLPEIWGSGGAERLLQNGTYEMVEISESTDMGLNEASTWITRLGIADRCERKHGCLVAHLRELDPKAFLKARERILEKWTLIAERYRLGIREFDMSIELHFLGRDKRFVIKSLLAEMEEGTPVAYLGDSVTDEDAFDAINGRGLSVLVREEFHQTKADLWLRPPGELFQFLCNWVKLDLQAQAGR